MTRAERERDDPIIQWQILSRVAQLAIDQWFELTVTGAFARHQTFRYGELKNQAFRYSELRIDSRTLTNNFKRSGELPILAIWHVDWLQKDLNKCDVK